jgi:hypothetical protein
MFVRMYFSRRPGSYAVGLMPIPSARRRIAGILKWTSPESTATSACDTFMPSSFSRHLATRTADSAAQTLCEVYCIGVCSAKLSDRQVLPSHLVLQLCLFGSIGRQLGLPKKTTNPGKPNVILNCGSGTSQFFRLSYTLSGKGLQVTSVISEPLSHLETHLSRAQHP